MISLSASQKMQYIKDLKIALKDMEPMVKDPKFLRIGRSIENFSLRPREAWANLLLCAVLQHLYDDDITFMEDTQGDGILWDKRLDVYIPTEHVSALGLPPHIHSKKALPKGEARIIEAINHKIARGPKYSKGKYLIVFFDGADVWYRNKVREAINGKHNFSGMYLIGLLTLDQNGHAYSVTEVHKNDSTTFKVQIKPDFSDYTVTRIP